MVSLPPSGQMRGLSLGHVPVQRGRGRGRWSGCPSPLCLKKSAWPRWPALDFHLGSSEGGVVAHPSSVIKVGAPGISLVVRWLGLCTLTASGRGSILGWGTKMPQAAGCSHTHRGPQHLFCRESQGPYHRILPLSLECGPNRAVLRISRPAVARTFRLFKRTQRSDFGAKPL